MPVTLTTTFRLPSSIPLTDKALMREIGLLALEQIRTRTRQGTDMRGQPFEPYSQAYLKQKSKETGAPSTVNLTLSGTMLNTLHITEVTDTSVTLGWFFSQG
jgi:hypothetical protein